MRSDGHLPAAQRTLFKVLSLLLDYPEEGLLHSLPELSSVLDEMPNCRAKSACREFLNYLGTNPLNRLQEQYTRTFDLQPAASLNLTCHSNTPGNERGLEMAHFKQLYQNAGFDPVGRELPDFLPMVLEFMYVAPEETTMGLWERIGPSVQVLALNLRQTQSPYAQLVDTIAHWRTACSIGGDA
jgi:nitrate reductase delta subunit